VVFLLAAGCASQPYTGTEVGSASFLDRKVTLTEGELRVDAAAPDAGETLALTGLDLYEQGIQPVWIRVENRGEVPARVVTWSVDRTYFSPIEVAYMNRKPYSDEGYASLERWFHENALPRSIPAGESREGLVFTHLKPGTKGFNLVVLTAGETNNFTFFLPMPGFVPDFMTVDFETLYAPAEIRDVDRPGLKSILENELSCCVTDATGELTGGPLNVALVGTGRAVRRAMLRGDWLETSAAEDVAVKARTQHFRGRKPDAIFSQQRGDGNERIQLHLWLAPWRVDGEPVWVGQVYYFTAEKSVLGFVDSDVFRDSELLSYFAAESVQADVDSAQRFLFQNLWYNGSLRLSGFTQGVGAATVENPASGFGGVAWFTRGLRLVAFLSEEPVALDEAQFVFDRGNPEAIAGQADPAKGPRVFQGAEVPAPNDRLYEQTDGNLVITASVPSSEETEQIYGTDLYRKNVQPVWIQVENRGDTDLFLTPMGIDPGYFTPRETANRTRSGSRDRVAEQFEKRGHETLNVPAQSIQSGYVFTRVDEGTKSFNVDVLGDGAAHLLNFNVPVPGLRLDHYEVDIAGTYDESELRHVDLAQLVAELEAMPCCVRDAKGVDKGDPLNLVFIGEIKDLYYAFMRAGWDETETIYSGSLTKTASSTLFGSEYRYSPVSALYVFGRPQDAALQRARSSIDERNHLRIWLTPLRFKNTPVWIGQISRDIGVHFTKRTITTHKIDPDVDETREYLLEDMAFSQGLRGFGYVGGTGAAPYEAPRGNLTGDPYFTDGSSEPIGLDEIVVKDLTPYHTGVIGD